MSFDEAFQKMPLYRKNCSSCDYICHLEMNSLYSFNPNSIFKGLKYLYKDKFLSLFKRKIVKNKEVNFFNKRLKEIVFNFKI